jgi:hypothetical protein
MNVELRYRQALDLPGSTGPTGRRSYKDDDGALVKRVEVVGTVIASADQRCGKRRADGNDQRAEKSRSSSGKERPNRSIPSYATQQQCEFASIGRP